MFLQLGVVEAVSITSYPMILQALRQLKKKQTASIHNHYKAFFIIFFVILQFRIIQKDKYMDQSHKIVRW